VLTGAGGVGKTRLAQQPPAMAVVMKPYRSVRMCWKASSTLRLERLALLVHQAATLTATPTSAVISCVRSNRR
jgi:hypothetical protein